MGKYGLRALLVFSVLFGNGAWAQPESDCYPGLATIGEYRQPPEVLADKIAKQVTSDTFSFPLPEPLTVKQGDVVDITSGSLLKEGKPVTSITQGFAISRSGIFVGTAKNSKGGEEIVLDAGGGKFLRIPVSQLRSLLRSSSNVKASTGTLAERIYGSAKNAKLLTTDFLWPVFDRMVQKGLPVAMGAYSTYVWSKLLLENGSELFQAHPYAMSGVLAAGTVGLLRSKSARALASLGVELPYAIGKATGSLGVLAWVMATNYRAIVESRAVSKEIGKLSAVSEAAVKEKLVGQELKVDDLGRVIYSGESNNLRTFYHLPEGAPDEGFFEKAKAGHEEAVLLKNYLVSLGVPDLQKPLNVWISDKGIPKLPGPFSAESLNILYMGPFSFTEAQRKAFDKKEAEKPGQNRKLATNESLDEIGTDGTVFGHELTHALIHNLLAGTTDPTAVQGPVEEALADYFPMSAKNLNEPVLGFGQFYQGLPMREGVERNYEGDYPEHLNFNTTAQISGDVHGSSQVVGRYLWRLRSQMGRDKLDKIIVEALPHVSRYRKQGELLFRSPPSYGKAINPIATFRNQREAYVFVAALMHASRASGASEAEQRAIAVEATKSGMPLDAVMAIHDMKLDSVPVPAPAEAPVRVVGPRRR